MQRLLQTQRSQEPHVLMQVRTTSAAQELKEDALNFPFALFMCKAHITMSSLARTGGNFFPPKDSLVSCFTTELTLTQ